MNCGPQFVPLSIPRWSIALARLQSRSPAGLRKRRRTDCWRGRSSRPKIGSKRCRNGPLVTGLQRLRRTRRPYLLRPRRPLPYRPPGGKVFRMTVLDVAVATHENAPMGATVAAIYAPLSTHGCTKSPSTLRPLVLSGLAPPMWAVCDCYAAADTRRAYCCSD